MTKKKEMKNKRNNACSFSRNNCSITHFGGNNYHICLWRKWSIQISARGKRQDRSSKK